MTSKITFSPGASDALIGFDVKPMFIDAVAPTTVTLANVSVRQKHGDTILDLGRGDTLTLNLEI